MLFAAAYLIVHGLIKLFLVRACYWKVVGIPSVALVSCRVHRVPMLSLRAHAFISLVLLTVFDLAVVFLIWREYQSRQHVHLQPLV